LYGAYKAKSLGSFPVESRKIDSERKRNLFYIHKLYPQTWPDILQMHAVINKWVDVVPRNKSNANVLELTQS
jgi:hypothetical protein